MDLYYHRSALGNFGDDLNAWIWDELLPGWRDWRAEATLVGVGTLLSTDLQRRVRARRFLVAGSGVGYGEGPPDVADRSRWDLRSVRGPRSAAALGLPRERGVIDPAMMIAEFPAFRGLARSATPVFVPHESTVARHPWADACAEAGLAYVSPRGAAGEVIASIAAAPLVLAESMHAAILADAFRVPWIPVRIGHKFLASKWLDWAESLSIPLGVIPPLFAFEDRLFAVPRAVALKRRARRREPVVADGEGVGPAADASAPRVAPPPPNRPARVLRLQIGLEAARIAPALRTALTRRAYLSDTATLERQRARYRDVLEGVRRDYA